MKKVFLSLLVAGCLCLASCESKESCINDLKALVENVQENGGEFTEEQWDKANEKFGQLIEKINAYEDLSEEEVKEVYKLQGQYSATVLKETGKNLKNQLKKAGEAINGFLDGLKEGKDKK